MNNREAIKVIEWIKNTHPERITCEALDMAISALEKQEQVNTQSVNLTHTTYPNALESLNILESAKDENGCVPMSLVRQAFRNVLEQDRKEAYEKGLSDAWDAARKIADMPYDEEEKVFGSGGWAFITKHTASEAIEKIRQYEQEQDRQARIEYNFDVDEIKDVLNTTMQECNVSLDEIAEVLERMREGE